MSGAVARPLVDFVLDEVCCGDLATRFAEALGAVTEQDATERAQQDGGEVALLADGVEAIEDKWGSLSLFFW